MLKNFKMIITLISLIGMILSTTLLKHHVDLSYKSPLCGVGENSGCNVLNRSDASEFLGIPLAYFGYLYYGFVMFLGMFVDRGKSNLKIIFLMSAFALFTDIGLLFYSIFVAETLCILCAMTYTVTLALFILSYLQISRSKSGFIPDFKDWQIEKIPLRQIIVLIFAFVPVSGGFFYYAYSSGGSSGQVKSRGSYVDHLMIAENEYLKAYENSQQIHFRVDPLSRKGPVKGIINIVEFADYLCPHCRVMSEELNRFVNKYPDEVSVTYRHYPLDQDCNPAITQPFHRGSCLLSYASYCALKQNKFWDLHHTIFEHQDTFLKNKGASKEDVLNLSSNIGLSRTFMAACMEDKETKQAVSMDVQEANELGINSTPTIYIDGRKMDFNDFLVERLMLYKKKKEMRANGH